MAFVGAGTASAAPAPPELKAATPTISGTLAVGSTLTAKTGTWTSKTKFTYRWLRDAVAIGSATKSTYKLTAADAGKQLSVEVTGKRSGYTSVTRTSAATAKVVSAPTPTISGTAAVGSKLTATTKAWSTGMVLSHQWLRSGDPIKDATGPTYEVTSSDAGRQLSVRVTGKQDGWATIARTSSQTAKVLKVAAPKISGTLAVGSTLKVQPGTWTSKTKFSYQWLRDGKTISRATKSSYKLASADAGKQVSVKVTGKRSGYVTATRTSPATAKVVSAPAPTVSGSAVIGSTLTSATKAWSAGMVLSYQWLRSGDPISGATGKTYVVTGSDAGRQLSVRVTGKQDGWATIARTSSQTAKVLKVAVPKISGTVAVGKTVKVSVGSWTSGTKFSYQWLRDGSSISGAKSSSYKIPSSLAGKKLSVKVTGKRSGYATATRTSAEVTVALMVLQSSTPKITGDLHVGRKQTAQPGTWTSGTSLAYQWYADGEAIKGATKSTYTLTYKEIGKYFSIKVTGSKPGYATVTKSSASRGPVPTIANAFGSNFMYLVGVDVMPGTYTASGGTECVWWRSKDDTFSEKSIIAAGPLHNGRVVVTLRPGEYFYAYECGSWYFDGFHVEQKMPYFYDGDHTIDVSIHPGTYISTGGEECFWWRLDSVGGNYIEAEPGKEGVLGAGPIHNGQTIVQITPSDPHFVSTGCGRWDPLPTEPSPVDAAGDGDYAVGIHLLAGEWETTSATALCYVERASGFAGTYDEIIWPGEGGGETELSLEILPTDVRFTTVGCGTWQRVGDIETGKAAAAGRKAPSVSIRSAGLDTGDIARRLRSER